MSNNRSKGVAINPNETKHTALVYRGPAADCNGDGCSEALATLLKSVNEWNFHVQYVGSEDEGDMSVKEGLQLPDAILYAQPGGGRTEKEAFKHLEECAPDVREFIRNGGRYLGICMGAYLAGNSDIFPGFDFGFEACQYIYAPNATVTDDEDTIVQVNWNMRTGPQAGHTIPRCMYFQDGPYFIPENGKSDQIILAKYMTDDPTDDYNYIAAMVLQCGKGWVGVCGPHPEADRSWYDEKNLPFPGSTVDLGLDLINTLMRQI
jgi:glutamine amidotransferase-like uncharacterized protein